MGQVFNGACDRKVPGGKLVRVRIELEPGGAERLRSVRVYGDFFMYPESLIEDIEAVLLESGLALERARAGLNSLFKRPDVNVYGAGVEDLLITFTNALEDARSKLPV